MIIIFYIWSKIKNILIYSIKYLYLIPIDLSDFWHTWKRISCTTDDNDAFQDMIIIKKSLTKFPLRVEYLLYGIKIKFWKLIIFIWEYRRKE